MKLAPETDAAAVSADLRSDLAQISPEEIRRTFAPAPDGEVLFYWFSPCRLTARPMSESARRRIKRGADAFLGGVA